MLLTFHQGASQSDPNCGPDSVSRKLDFFQAFGLAMGCLTKTGQILM